MASWDSHEAIFFDHQMILVVIICKVFFLPNFS